MNKTTVVILTSLLLALTPVQLAAYEQVNSHGLDIYYRVFGDGEPVLVIGGGPGDNSNRYLSLCELLSSDFSCILVDQRGTGKSYPEIYDASTLSIDLTLDDFEAIRKELGLDTWHVLGFSYGGYLSSLYAHFFPASVDTLILLNSMGLNTDAFGHFMDNIFSGMSEEDQLRYEFWNDPDRKAADPDHALVERIRAMMPGYFYGREAALLVTETMKDSDFNFELGNYIWPEIDKRKLDLTEMELEYSGPTLILHGRQDPLGESVALELQGYYKHANLVFIERAGHYSWLEQPDEVLESIKDKMGLPSKPAKDVGSE